MDNRIQKLANILVNYSCRLEANEKVLIEASIGAKELVKEIVKEVYKKGAFPFVKLSDAQISAEIIRGTNEAHTKFMCKYALTQMQDMDAYIGISAQENAYEQSGLPQDKMELYVVNYSKPVHSEERVNNTKWVILQYPTPSFAQLSMMSTEDFEDFYFKVCNLDYAKMAKAMEKLVTLMEKTDKVHIINKNTNLSFSIKGMKAIKCAGEMNIPDGEVYTAPIKNSVNGYLTYNVPTMYNGTRFDNVRLDFENGKIVNATASSKNEELNNILDTDEGARYIGEFAIGVNPFVNEPMLDILFDEKINGSFHFTPGASYKDAFNGNISAVHWDMVQIQRPDYGGGEIWFDDKLIRKDGLFVVEELFVLNPENLK